jgi:hypothetical protein
LDSKQGAEFRLVLKDKLDQPHLRDLARNPMQLAILLSLVLTRGSSLPDKRTALYDFYIDLFFSREAEKSTVVRNHRELLIDIHRHLAWLLQSQAEGSNARPSVPQEQLQQLVSDYLVREGHPPDLAKELFTGMIERVVALVSRVEGTFEFEVQPLQEYFAACHLYYTAPQSSPGKEMPGSKPDRFDAIAKNFYWQNVTRFYAGCYSKGELPSLVERLQELASSPGFKIISYPRTLAATLLSDWVFTQNPKSVQQVVELITRPDSLRYVLAPFETRRFRAGVQNPLILPPRCGRDELIKRCFEELDGTPPPDLTLQILDLLRANAESASDVHALWFKHTSEASIGDRRKWLSHGVQLGSLSTVDLDKLQTLVGDPALASDPRVLSSLFRARRLDFLHSSEALFEDVVSLILDGRIAAQPQRRIESPLDALSHALDMARYSGVFGDRQPIPLAQYWESRNRAAKLSWSPQLTTTTESFPSHSASIELAQIAEKESHRSVLEWSTDMAPWSAIVEAGRKVWGDRWALITLANFAAGIRSTADKCSDCSDLLNADMPLVRRVRYARLRSGAHKWWSSQIEASGSESDLLFVLLIFFTWATPSTWLVNHDLVNAKLNTLSPNNWYSLFRAVRRCTHLVRLNDDRSEKVDLSKLPEKTDLRFAAMLSDRLSDIDSSTLYSKFIKDQVSDDPVILELTERQSLDLPHVGTSEWTPDLDTLHTLYTRNVVAEPPSFRRKRHLREPGSMNLGIAEKILASPAAFPGYLVTSAEDSYRAEVARRVTTVAAVAEAEKWFQVP